MKLMHEGKIVSIYLSIYLSICMLNFQNYMSDFDDIQYWRYTLDVFW